MDDKYSKCFKYTLIVANCLAFVFDRATAAEYIKVVGKQEVVFDSRGENCNNLAIPDSPARAIRSGNRIIVIAAQHSNTFLEGTSFDNLNPNCNVQSYGSENPDPGAFDDRFWIQGIQPLPSGRVLAIASHEYMGKRHPGRCRNERRDGFQCWYSSLVLAQGDVNTLKFSLLPLNERVLAAPQTAYSENLEKRTGFLTSSNIIINNNHLYFIGYAEMPKWSGNCLFRTNNMEGVSGWAALSSNGFDLLYRSRFFAKNTEKATPGCNTIGQKSPIRSVVWSRSLSLWISVFTLHGGDSGRSGVYYATSEDLTNWSVPKKLISINLPSEKSCGILYEYPSIIDHGSDDLNYQSVGKGPYLYLVKFDWTDCRRGLKRDLVRFKLEIL